MTTPRSAEGAQIFEVDAILFDIDGTLVDSTDAVERMWTAWGERFGIDPEPILAVSHGVRSEEVVAHFLPPEQRASALADFEEIELAENAHAEALPGAAELLAALPAGRWAAVTSGRRAIMAPRLRASGLPVPEIFIAAEDVTEGKPSPEGYRRAATLLGFAADRCLVLEDAPAGLQAGNAAGAVTIGVTTSHPQHLLVAADHVVPDLTHLRVEPHGSRLRVSLA